MAEAGPDAMREIHRNVNQDEFQYYIQAEARTFNYRGGDVGYVPMGGFHYVQNTGRGN